ncbi:MAG: SRPBCC family protein [Planctomycetota bacterium]
MTDSFARMVGSSQLEIVRILPARRERVWEYLVDPRLRSQWFCGGETGQNPGEPFVMDFDHSRISDSPPPDDVGCGDPIVMRGTLTVFEPPCKLAYEWPGQEAGDTSLVTIELTQQGENTHLRLVHSRLTNPEFQKGASAGWHAHLDLLIDLVAGVTVRDFWLHYAEVKSHYETVSVDPTT